jgi:hypothetical protein
VRLVRTAQPVAEGRLVALQPRQRSGVLCTRRPRAQRVLRVKLLGSEAGERDGFFK